MIKKNNVVSIPVDKEFAKFFKIQANMQGISRLELSRKEAKKIQDNLNFTFVKRKNEENKFPFRY
jgi:hypothetical protein